MEEVKSHMTRCWRVDGFELRFRAKGATDLSFRFCYVPETRPRSNAEITLLGAGVRNPVPPGQWGDSRSLENVLASAERPDGASGTRKSPTPGLRRPACAMSLDLAKFCLVVQQ